MITKALLNYSQQTSDLVDKSMSRRNTTQDKEELKACCERLRLENLQKPIETVLEIGVYSGGTLLTWGGFAVDDALLIGVDRDPLVRSEELVNKRQDFCLVRGDSHHKKTLQRVKKLLGDKEIDFLFIDGDHSTAGCRMDFDMYSQLVRRGGLIAFHDVAEGGVNLVWGKVSEAFPEPYFFFNEEDSRKGGYRFGIGLMRVPLRGPRMLDFPSISCGITVYGNPPRLRHLLSNLRWSGIPEEITFRVFEDPKDRETSLEYEKICEEYKVPYYRAPSWGCMHRIGQFAVLNSPEDWFIYLPDDVLLTKGHLANIVQSIYDYHFTSVGAFQTPYWNADELVEKYQIVGPKDKNELWRVTGFSVLNGYPENPYWSKCAPRIYVNLNGAGFILRRKAWELVGGFSPDTWCLDEDIACRIWYYTGYNIFTLPGPPLIHYFGATSADGTQPDHKFWTGEAWEKAWGMDKKETHRLIRLAMEDAGGDGCLITEANDNRSPLCLSDKFPRRLKKWENSSE